MSRVRLDLMISYEFLMSNVPEDVPESMRHDYAVQYALDHCVLSISKHQDKDDLVVACREVIAKVVPELSEACERKISTFPPLSELQGSKAAAPRSES